MIIDVETGDPVKNVVVKLGVLSDLHANAHALDAAEDAAGAGATAASERVAVTTSATGAGVTDAMGVSTISYKLLAFAMGGAIGSVGGALFA